jgi:DNA-directed RNA polymerase specialized sigma24 family protein
VTRSGDCHKTRSAIVVASVDARREAAVGVTFDEARLANETEVDLETIFHARYKRMCRVVARVLRDPARAEELAVEVFLKWSRHPGAQGAHAEGWLYRTAVHEALDELCRQTTASGTNACLPSFLQEDGRALPPLKTSAPRRRTKRRCVWS